MRIGLDFDDVIAHSHILKSIIVKDLYGIEIEASRFRREFVVGSLLTNEQYLNAVRKVFLGEYPVPAVPGAIESINLLKKEGHSLKIITSRSVKGGELRPAMDWLKENSIQLPVVGVGYGNSKAEACAGLDLFVDDDPAKLHELVGIVPHLLFFCWPHNQHEHEPRVATRVYSWNDALHYINRLNRGK